MSAVVNPITSLNDLQELLQLHAHFNKTPQKKHFTKCVDHLQQKQSLVSRVLKSVLNRG